MCDKNYLPVWHDSIVRVTRLIYTFAMTHSYVCHDSFVRQPSAGWRKPIGCLSCRSISAKKPLIIGLFCGKWPVNIRHPMTLRQHSTMSCGIASRRCVIWLIHTCDTTHSYVSHDSFIRVTRLIHTCVMTHSYVWHDSFVRVSSLMYTCDPPHSYVRHDSFVLVHVTRLIRMCALAHSYVSHDSFLR